MEKMKETFVRSGLQSHSVGQKTVLGLTIKLYGSVITAILRYIAVKLAIYRKQKFHLYIFFEVLACHTPVMCEFDQLNQVQQLRKLF